MSFSNAWKTKGRYRRALALRNWNLPEVSVETQILLSYLNYVHIRGAQNKRKVNIVVIEKWSIKTVGVKRKQIFFSGKANQNKVGAKVREIFFIRRAKKNEVGSKERLACPALMLEKKRGNRVTLFLQPILFHFSMATIFTFLSRIWRPLYRVVRSFHITSKFSNFEKKLFFFIIWFFLIKNRQGV